MDNNPMKTIYQHFGKEKEDDQEVFSIANIFHEMGKGEEEEKNEDRKHARFR